MDSNISDETVDRLTEEVIRLDPQPRARRWVSLSFCIVDAVWSIGARYQSVVVPIVTKVAEDFDIAEASVPNSDPVAPDPVPLSRFVEHYDLAGLLARTNNQRTSTAGGILKAEAVLQYASILREHGIGTISEASDLLSDDKRFGAADSSLRKVKGDGTDGIRRGYLWMLVGDSTKIKPDRMVLRWFRHHDSSIAPADAADVVRRIVERMNARQGERAVTPWEVDHALWQAGRSLPRR